MLISVHLPKTAGSSFKKILEEHFHDDLYLDYNDLPIQEIKARRYVTATSNLLKNSFRKIPQSNCIHGHFLPFKYKSLAIRNEVRYVTWLRDPVDRLYSHYHYWQRCYDRETSGPLWRKVIDENWTVEEFCISNELRNFYSQYLWMFPLERFIFIGISEYFDSDVQYFMDTFFGVKVDIPHENSNPDAVRKGYDIDDEMRKKIEEFHSKDVLLYRKALLLRTERITKIK